MPDPSAQHLHTVMEPVWKVWPELRPTRLEYDVKYGFHLRHPHLRTQSTWINNDTATAACLAVKRAAAHETNTHEIKPQKELN